MKPVILYRPNSYDDPEMPVAQKHIPLVTQRAAIKSDSLVIPRYSALPFYRELDNDVRLLGGRLINSFAEHEYVADIGAYVEDLRELTFRTWHESELSRIPDEGPYVLKGQTNSRKAKFLTHMFARTKKEAVEVYLRLKDDPLFEKQDIYIRKFVQLQSWATDLSGIAISTEFRFFTLDGKILSSGFYWTNHVENGLISGTETPIPTVDCIPQVFLDQVLERISGRCPFTVVDVALQTNGEPIVVELNDASMSGISGNDPDVLYGGLARALV